jgi:hypothetical protein
MASGVYRVLHDLVLGQQPALVLNQENQQVEGFWSQGQRFVAAKQEVFLGFPAIGTEFAETLCIQSYTGAPPPFGFSLAFLWKLFGVH